MTDYPRQQWTISPLATFLLLVGLVAMLVVVYFVSEPQQSYVCERFPEGVASTVCVTVP